MKVRDELIIGVVIVALVIAGCVLVVWLTTLSP